MTLEPSFTWYIIIIDKMWTRFYAFDNFHCSSIQWCVHTDVVIAATAAAVAGVIVGSLSNILLFNNRLFTPCRRERKKEKKTSKWRFIQYLKSIFGRMNKNSDQNMPRSLLTLSLCLSLHTSNVSLHVPRLWINKLDQMEPHTVHTLHSTQPHSSHSTSNTNTTHTKRGRSRGRRLFRFT